MGSHAVLANAKPAVERVPCGAARCGPKLRLTVIETERRQSRPKKIHKRLSMFTLKTVTHYDLMLEEEAEIALCEFLFGALALSNGRVENELFHFLQSDDFFFH